MRNRIVLALLFLSIFISNAFAVNVSLDIAGSSAKNVPNGTDISVTLNTTMGTVEDNIIWIGISWQDDATGLDGDSLSTVTVDGNSATFYASAINSGEDDVYYYLITAGGNHTITATACGPPDCDGGINVVLGCVSYKNVSASTPLGTASTATGNLSPITVNVTGVSSNNMVADSAHSGGVFITLTPGASQTQDWNTRVGLLFNGAGSHQTSSNGTITMSWTESAAALWATVAGEIKVGSAAVVHSLTALGVGN